MELKEKNKKDRKSLLIIIGFFFIIVGICIFIYNSYNSNKEEKKEAMSIESFFDKDKIDENDNDYEKNNPVNVESTNKKTNEKIINYVAVLEIPKINLKKGLVDKNSKDNNVNKNIYVIKESIFPSSDDKYSHVILASHSGTSRISYFKNLKKLEIDDKINFYYNGKKYIYIVTKKYEITKDGTFIPKYVSNNDITLITCIGYTKKQLVVSAKLVDEDLY